MDGVPVCLFGLWLPGLDSRLFPDYTESYLPQRFWREGWIANKTLQKLAGTNPGIRISSDLSL